MSRISQVMIKWRRRTSPLGRFTLWHNDRRATQLGKFTLWYNGRRTKPGLMHAPGIADIFQRQWRTMLKNKKPLSKVKFNRKLLKDERFERFSKHRSMYAFRSPWAPDALRRQNIRPQQNFERWTPRTQESPLELARQSEAKRKQAPQSEANVCRRRRICNLQKTSLINCTGHPIMHRTPNTN